ncbi:MAG: quinol:cytochrome C oxidoreductase [Bacillota bacterium]
MNPTDHAVNYSKDYLSGNSKKLPKQLNLIGWAMLVVGLIAIAASFFVDRTRSSFNLLILLMFLLSIGLGSLFLVALEYVAGAVWSTPVRRVSEFLSSALIFLPIVAIGLIFNMHELYHWTHAEAVMNDKILSQKTAYLNNTFFIIRVVLFILIWVSFYFFIIRNSRQQDTTKDQLLTKRNITLSAIFMPLFAITITFAAVDWMMSLEPHWYSTIFGVYYFSGTVLAALAATTLIVVLLRQRGYFPVLLLQDHLYSLGALMFAFVNFWAYIAFSQYLLIWYANIPEETSWMLLRWSGSWKYVSIGLIIVHFIIPYFSLLSQPAKMNPKRLLIMSVWILFAHLYDLYWIIMPTYSRSSAVFGWMELLFPVAVIGFLIILFTYKSRSNNLIPIGDPKLERGINFRL